MANIVRRTDENERGREVGRPTGGGYGWDPFRVMSDLLRWDPFRAGGAAMGRMGTEFIPEFDVREANDSYIISADLPGVREDDLDITVTQNMLTVSGCKTTAESKQDEHYYFSERSFGEFRRSFSLPEGADPDSAKAELKDGVLTLTLRKRPEVQPRRVSVGAKQQGTNPKS
jgi:HSP20 family protein